MGGLVQFGPLVMAADRLLAVGLMLAFLLMLDRIALRTGASSLKVGTVALIAGIAAARLAFVAKHYDAFSRDWWSALAIWQGGFVAWAGILAAALAVAWMLRPMRAMMKAQAALLLLSAAWFAGSALLRPDPVPMPELPALAHLDGSPAMAQGLAGKPYVINLWATWCPPCRRELPMLAEAGGGIERSHPAGQSGRGGKHRDGLSGGAGGAGRCRAAGRRLAPVRTNWQYGASDRRCS